LEFSYGFGVIERVVVENPGVEEHITAGVDSQIETVASLHGEMK
jgi:hypothetical protein